MSTKVPTQAGEARITLDEILDRLVDSVRERTADASPEQAARMARVIDLAQSLQSELRALADRPPPSPEQKGGA